MTNLGSPRRVPDTAEVCGQRTLIKTLVWQGSLGESAQEEFVGDFRRLRALIEIHQFNPDYTRAFVVQGDAKDLTYSQVSHEKALFYRAVIPHHLVPCYSSFNY